MIGKFISLEGVDGVGKTTNIAVVRDYLVSKGIKVEITREPGGTATGEKIREILLHTAELTAASELLLLFAARVQHIQEVIYPSLQAGRWVISDRYIDASYAYQGWGRGIDPSFIQRLEQNMPYGLLPDMTLLFDAAIDIGMTRSRERGIADRFDNEKSAFIQEVRQGYLDRAEQFPGRIKIIDASLSREEVAEAVRRQLALFFQ